MAEEDDSRTALIGQKRARNDEGPSVAGSTKRQKRGTEDDAISVGNSSDGEKEDRSNEFRRIEFTDVEAIARNDAGNDIERQMHPRFDHQFTPLNGPGEEIAVIFEPQTGPRHTQEKPTKSKKERKKEEKKKEEKQEKRQKVISVVVNRVPIPEDLNDEEALIHHVANFDSPGQLRPSTDLVFFADLATLPQRLRKASGRKVSRQKKLRNATINYCATFLLEGLIAIGSVPLKQWSKKMVEDCPTGLVFALRYAHEDDAARAERTMLGPRTTLDCSCMNPNIGAPTTAFIPKERWFQFRLIKIDELVQAQSPTIVFPLPTKKTKKAKNTERPWFVERALEGIKVNSEGINMLRFRSDVEEFATKRKEAKERAETKNSANNGPSPPANECNTYNTAEPISDYEDHQTRAELLEVIESSSSESGELTDSPSSDDEGGVAVPELTLPETVQTTPHGDLMPQSGPICLANLANDERTLQTRYWGISLDEELVRCPTCSQQGHMTATCPSRICAHCSLVDDHFSAACPSQQTCTKCRERGHSATSCPSKLIRSAVDGFTCVICAGGHPEEHCSWIWRSFNPALHRDIQKINHLDILGCYSCGASSHWGDDCPDPLRMKAKPAVSCCNTFSSAFANLFTIEQTEAPLPTALGGKGFCIKGRGNARSQPSRRDLEREREQEEEDELEEDFLRSRGNPKSQNNNARNNAKPMTFNIRGSAAGGGNGGGRQAANEPYAPQQHQQRAPYNDNQNGYRNVPPPQNYNSGQQGYNHGNQNQAYHGGRFAQETQNRRDLADRVNGGNALGGGRGRGGRGGGRGGGGGGNYRGHADNHRGGRA